MIQVRESAYPFAALTDTGLVREGNEDRYAITAFRSGKREETPGLLAVLSDGVGGETGGEVAAELAVETIQRHVLSSSAEHPNDVLAAAIRAANEVILASIRKRPSLTGMAATVACAWISGNRLSIATLGDTRIYLLRGSDEIHQLSTDHTWLQEAMDAGTITSAQKVGHPNAHVIRRFLGSDHPPEVDTHLHFPGQTGNQLALHPGDIVFLCTDGCSDLVRPEEIRERFAGQNLNKSLEEIKKLALDRGGRDNITMLAILVPEHPILKRRRSRLWLWILAIIAIVLAVAAGFYLGWLSQNSNPPVTPQASIPIPLPAWVLLFGSHLPPTHS